MTTVTEPRGRPSSGPFALRFPSAWVPCGTGIATAISIEVPDARPLLERHFESCFQAWVFEARMRQPENLLAPNEFSPENCLNTQLVLGPRCDWTAPPALRTPELCALLAAIPPGADLCAQGWTESRDAVLEIFRQLMDGFGLTVLGASALVYQKRPSLVPLLDRPTRQAFLDPTSEVGRARNVGSVLSEMRSVAVCPENASALERLTHWLADHPWSTRLLQLSRVRLLGIVAAEQMREHEPRPTRHPRDRTDAARAGRRRAG